MTWVKFAATVLPTLESLELWVGEGADQYVALVTAVHADAPRSSSGTESTTGTRCRGMSTSMDRSPRLGGLDRAGITGSRLSL